MSRRFNALAAAAFSLATAFTPVPAGAAEALATWTVSSATLQRPASHDGTVEAVRQTVVAAQVAGTVVALPVKAGDRVKAGQLLARLDARAAEQQAGAAAAQVEAARAAQQVATLEMQRQRQLFASQFISRAALDQAEAQFKTATAQANAQLAAAQAARTESGYFAVKAPYDGIVTELSVMPGDMAMPGRPLLTLFDPASLRVAIAVPETTAASLRDRLTIPISVEIAGQRLTATRWEVLPAADAVTHTVTVRIELPTGVAATPGSFARAWLPAVTGGTGTQRIFIPVRALVQRAELKAVYAVGVDGRALLRQVRVGTVSGDQVEVLSGLQPGERIAMDPQAAARRP
jgi:RND family efflux transporter MFP subunit